MVVIPKTKAYKKRTSKLKNRTLLQAHLNALTRRVNKINATLKKFNLCLEEEPFTWKEENGKFLAIFEGQVIATFNTLGALSKYTFGVSKAFRMRVLLVEAFGDQHIVLQAKDNKDLARKLGVDAGGLTHAFKDSSVLFKLKSHKYCKIERTCDNRYLFGEDEPFWED